MFSFFINELAIDISKGNKHGIQLIPETVEFFYYYLHDVVLVSDTDAGLQNQLNVIKQEADKLKLIVKFDKTNVIVFRKGGPLSSSQRCLYDYNYDNIEVKAANTYKYLEVHFSTQKSCTAAWNELCTEGKCSRCF